MIVSRRLKIVAPNRLHICLLAMDRNLYRKNGGAGFAVDFNNLDMEFERAEFFRVIDPGHLLGEDRCAKLLNILESAKNERAFKNCIEIHVVSAPKAHLGLGSGTSLMLASIEALFLLNNENPRAHDIVDLSGRGGTSGVGINTYFHGGFVCDIGRKIDSICHAPSSVVPSGFKKPLTLLSTKMPDWNFGVCIVNDIQLTTAEEEVKFFDSTCPISKSDVEETLYHVLFGTVGGVLELDCSAFSSSINAIQKTKWKSSEIDLYGDRFRKVIELLTGKCNCVGMSSLGPILYFISNDLDRLILDFKSDSSITINKINVNNEGRRISYV
jgi:beta-ribofuranosylaminobenzene 5'-phosphate synthase